MEARRGQSLIEVLVATGIFVLIVSAIAFLILEAYSSNRQGAERTLAVALSQEGLEAAKSLKNQRFGNLAPGDHGITAASGSWKFSGSNDVIGKFTRTVTVSPVNRDAGGNVIASGGTLDFDTRKITSRVSWLFTPLRQNAVELVTLLTNWRGRSIKQTTQSEFDGGTKTGVRTTAVNGGEVRLATVPASGTYGNVFQVTGTTSLGAMTNNNRRTALRFTAQRAGVAASVRFFVHSVTTSGGNPTFRIGVQGNTSGRPSGTWLDQVSPVTVTAAGWRTATFTAGTASLVAGQTYYIVVEPLNANNNRNAAVRGTTPLNAILPSGGANPAANTLFTTNSGSSWSTVGAQPVYVVTLAGGATEGDPYTDFAEPQVFGATAVGEEFTLSSTVTIGSITASVKRVGAPADDLFVTVEDVTAGTTVESGTFVTRSGASTSYTPATYTFLAPIQFQSGRTYRLSFRSAGSTSGAWYTIGRMAFVTGDPVLAGIDYDGTSSRYTASTAPPTWNPLNEADIAFSFRLSNGFAPTGEFISSVIDTGSTGTLYNYLAWNGTVPAGANLRFQVRTSDAAGSLGSQPWIGPDGTSATFFTVPGDSITSGPGGVRYLQYRALFTPFALTAPVVEDVTINYE